MNTAPDNTNNASVETTACGPAEIVSLIAELGGHDREARRVAHESLLNIGEPATRCLVEALASKDRRQRWEAGKVLEEIKVNWRQHADSRTILALVEDLGSKDGMARVWARRALVTIGPPAVGALVEVLASKQPEQRWEAAKALGQIGDPQAIGSLIKALEDEMFDVRWLAAEALVHIGRLALPSLMTALSQNGDSLWMREGVHHVLHGINKSGLENVLEPVLKALEDVDSTLEVPIAARAALRELG